MHEDSAPPKWVLSVAGSSGRVARFGGDVDEERDCIGFPRLFDSNNVMVTLPWRLARFEISLFCEGIAG